MQDFQPLKPTEASRKGGSRFPHTHKEILSPKKSSPQEAVSAAFFQLCPEMMLVQPTESPGARCLTRRESTEASAADALTLCSQTCTPGSAASE